MKILASTTQPSSGVPTVASLGGVEPLVGKSRWRAVCVGGSPTRQG